MFGAYFNAGECCNAGSRLILHESIADAAVERIRRLSADVKVGDPLDPATQVGAIITPEHLSKIAAYVDAAAGGGATIAHGGTPLDLGMGQYMAPTILSGVLPDMAVAREEVFGPVLSVLTFEHRRRRLSPLPTRVDYGLSAAVWSRDFDTCLTVGRRVRAGTIWMNTFMDGASELPFGGTKQSGLGRELGRHAVEDYTGDEDAAICISAGEPHGGCRRTNGRPRAEPNRSASPHGERGNSRRKWFSPRYSSNGRIYVLKFLTTTALALALMGGAARAAENVEVLHWWTSGGEATALDVLKKDLESKGIAWTDMPVAGGGGTEAMTVLRARVTSGNAPTAVQMLGFDILDWAKEGVARQSRRDRRQGELGQGGADGAPAVLEI